MTPKLKFNLAIRTAQDPAAFLVAAAVAGVEQERNNFPGYGQELRGYAKRYGSAYSDRLVGAMIGHAILPALLHQDPRYFYHGSGSIRSRIFYALSAAVVCRGDSGQLEPNYSAVLGSFAAAGISNLYRAPRDRSAGRTFRNGLIVIGSGAAVNLIREFISRKVNKECAILCKWQTLASFTPAHRDIYTLPRPVLPGSIGRALFLPKSLSAVFGGTLPSVSSLKGHHRLNVRSH